MLEQYVRSPSVLARIDRNPLRGHIRRLTDYLHGRGYRASTILGQLSVVEHFGKWLSTRRRRLRGVTEESVRTFLQRHLPQCTCSPPAPRCVDGVRQALSLLLLCCGPKVRPTPTPAERLVREYVQHLDEVCGAAQETLHCRARYAREFLASQMSKGHHRPSMWTVQDVMRFALGYFERCKRSSALVAACSLRNFLRYIHSRGLCNGRLVHAVPSIPQRKQEGLPRIMTEEQRRRFLSSFSRSDATSRRDYAMALFMVELGLRASDVIGLELDDIDWRNGTVRVRSSKERRARVLPLSSRIGKATASYLRNGRPISTHRQVFLRHTLPVGFPTTRCTVRRAVCRAYERSGFPIDWTGTHILRHTAATRLLCRGVSLKEIADILGHQSIDTSAIYAKVNLPALGAVALPWPEVKS